MVTSAYAARSLWALVALIGVGSTAHSPKVCTARPPQAALWNVATAPRADTKRLDGRQLKRRYRVTAYCDRGLTAAGVPSGVGQCAAPADIPLGSVVYIPALKRSFVVTDRTHERFRHNTVDIFIPNKSDCINFGRRYLDCVFTIDDTPPRYGELRVASVLAGEQDQRTSLAQPVHIE